MCVCDVRSLAIDYGRTPFIATLFGFVVVVVILFCHSVSIFIFCSFYFLVSRSVVTCRLASILTVSYALCHLCVTGGGELKITLTTSKCMMMMMMIG